MAKVKCEPAFTQFDKVNVREARKLTVDGAEVETINPDHFTTPIQASYDSPNSFSMTGNQTQDFQIGRRVQLDSGQSDLTCNKPVFDLTPDDVFTANKYDYSVITAVSYDGAITDITIADSIVTPKLEEASVDINWSESQAGLITTTDLINSTQGYPSDYALETIGFYVAGDGGGAKWVQNGVIAQTPSQSPAQLASALINDANGNQWAISFGSIDIRQTGASENLDSSDHIQAAINTASAVVNTIIPNKIDQVFSAVIIPPGQFEYSAIDIPDGVYLNGIQSSTSILVDVGHDISRASIEVGGTTREYSRCGLRNVGVRGASIPSRDGIRFRKTYRLCGLFECDIDSFYRNVVCEEFFAASFIHNRVYSAVTDNFYIENGTATRFQDNRIEIAGHSNINIDGQGSNEPINISFNSDKIQSAQRHGVLGVDVLSIEMNDCFLEANNQQGGYNHIELVGGTAARERGVFKMSGGFMSPGSGQADTAIQVGNIKTVLFDPCFIRGPFDEGIRLGSGVEHCSIFGVIDGPTTQTVIPEGVSYQAAIRGEEYTIKGIKNQKELKRVRSISSNSNSQDLDTTVLINTSGGNVIYTIRTTDVLPGRRIELQKTTGDANRLVVRTEGAELINNDAIEYFVTSAFAHLTITCDGVNWYAN